MINVPHAFTPEYPADETQPVSVKVPVILNTYDGYQCGENSHDLAIDVEETFETICDLTWCHQSQIAEWLPWVGRHQMAAPQTRDAWKGILRERFLRQNRELGFDSGNAFEMFTVTAWGEVPTVGQLIEDFPSITSGFSPMKKLEERLARWHGW
jgi:hypothetical protein